MTIQLLNVEGAYKRFGGVHALSGASLVVNEGEIVGLLGENGAGKSTLVKTLAGLHSLDAGTVTISGRPFVQGNPRAAREQGVAVIYQEPSLFPDLSLAENVFVGRQPTSGGRVNWNAMVADTRELFGGLGIDLDPLRPARGLSIADQQMVEIVKALSIDATLIIMDEPSAALSSAEVAQLMAVARRLKSQGRGVVYISHRLDEVQELCDSVTVMRDGATVATAAVAEIDTAQIVRWMVGREITEMFPKLDAEVGSVVLTVDGLTRDGVFHDISFEVRQGEIVALAGLVGAGRSEVVRAIFGIDRHDAGTVTMAGRPLANGSPAAAMSAGIALVPEDRRLQGLFMPAAISRNIAMTVLARLRSRLLLRNVSERRVAVDWASRLRLKYADIEDPVERLSGGNQQKVVLAKWLATDPVLLIVDEPTRGIDVGTKAEVHRLLSEQAVAGLAVLMVSSDLPEVLGMADRILVMREGRLVAEIARADATQESVMTAAALAGVAS
ncbi:MAG: sugar ABC transporter ATP-binding protein [Actinobacteria bacterium]|nr:sugar ABC transporter ATP-binding protein [Actinomycetota bacterium]